MAERPPELSCERDGKYASYSRTFEEGQGMKFGDDKNYVAIVRADSYRISVSQVKDGYELEPDEINLNGTNCDYDVDDQSTVGVVGGPVAGEKRRLTFKYTKGTRRRFIGFDEEEPANLDVGRDSVSFLNPNRASV